VARDFPRAGVTQIDAEMEDEGVPCNRYEIVLILYSKVMHKGGWYFQSLDHDSIIIMVWKNGISGTEVHNPPSLLSHS